MEVFLLVFFQAAFSVWFYRKFRKKIRQIKWYNGILWWFGLFLIFFIPTLYQDSTGSDAGYIPAMIMATVYLLVSASFLVW